LALALFNGLLEPTDTGTKAEHDDKAAVVNIVAKNDLLKENMVCAIY